ncbi:MAG TPA: hypothetical protein VK203_30805 [Nostocaceae cyanobacterium]|nr:hypothetical protein [Nostocaceae cyanobacterium]
MGRWGEIRVFFFPRVSVSLFSASPPLPAPLPHSQIPVLINSPNVVDIKKNSPSPTFFLTHY